MLFTSIKLFTVSSQFLTWSSADATDYRLEAHGNMVQYIIMWKNYDKNNTYFILEPFHYIYEATCSITKHAFNLFER
jgi:hypothetical protein